MIAPHALYVVEVKHWYGSIDATGQRWEFTSSKTGETDSRANVYRTVDKRCKVLKTRLKEIDPSLNRLWVQPAIVLTADHTFVAAETFVRNAVTTPKGLQQHFTNERLHHRQNAAGNLTTSADNLTAKVGSEPR